MKNYKDAYGTPIRLGSYIAYSVKHSTSVALHIAQVHEMTWEQGRGYSLGVISTGIRYDPSKPVGERWSFGAYKTHLISNSTILVLDPRGVHYKVFNAIEAFKEKEQAT